MWRQKAYSGRKRVTSKLIWLGMAVHLSRTAILRTTAGAKIIATSALVDVKAMRCRWLLLLRGRRHGLNREYIRSSRIGVIEGRLRGIAILNRRIRIMLRSYTGVGKGIEGCRSPVWGSRSRAKPINFGLRIDIRIFGLDVEVVVIHIVVGILRSEERFWCRCEVLMQRVGVTI